MSGSCQIIFLPDYEVKTVWLHGVCWTPSPNNTLLLLTSSIEHPPSPLSIEHPPSLLSNEHPPSTEPLSPLNTLPPHTPDIFSSSVGLSQQAMQAGHQTPAASHQLWPTQWRAPLALEAPPLPALMRQNMSSAAPQGTWWPVLRRQGRTKSNQGKITCALIHITNLHTHTYRCFTFLHIHTQTHTYTKKTLHGVSVLTEGWHVHTPPIAACREPSCQTVRGSTLPPNTSAAKKRTVRTLLKQLHFIPLLHPHPAHNRVVEHHCYHFSTFTKVLTYCTW